MKFYTLYFPKSNSCRSAFYLLAILCIFVFTGVAKAGVDDSLFRFVPAQLKFDTIPGLVSDENQVRAGLLYDVDRNAIVWQKDLDYAYPIASMTKMMVGLLAIEDIESGAVCKDDHVIVSRSFRKKVSRRRYTTYCTKEEYSLEDLLKMAMVASHNESTVWIAKHCSGDLETFIHRMNQKAQDLGMTKTIYSNPSGLPAIMRELDNSASPRDMLILSMELLKHPDLMQITNIPYATVSNGKSNSTYRNHNGLVITYTDDVQGFKTGYTKAAGFCLSATALRGDHRLISIVYGCRSPWVRNGIVASMMNTYYEAIKLGRLGETSPDVTIYKQYMDSVNRGLARIQPRLEPRHTKDTSDESYAVTYKTVTTKIKKPITVRSGDNLSKIADRNDVALSDLKKWNNLRSTNIHAGQKLFVYATVKKRIPVKLAVDPDESYADNQPDEPINKECETLVASEHVSFDSDSGKVNVAATPTKEYQPRQQIKAIAPIKATVNPKPTYIYHVVQQGDTLWNIAQRYSANIDQIKRVNNISNGRLLKKGARIKIPVKGG
ncbi:hypothetical protein BH11BAC2_BH11BAC2_04740 [soil metagenome]